MMYKTENLDFPGAKGKIFVFDAFGKLYRVIHVSILT